MKNLRFLRPFFRGLPLIVLSVILAVLVAKKYLSYVTPQYESTTKIKLADIAQGVPNNNLFKDFDVFASSNKIAAEIELMKSSVILNKALDQLNFDVQISRVGKIATQEIYSDLPFQLDVINLNHYMDLEFQLQVNAENELVLSVPNEEPIKANFGDTINLKLGSLAIKNKPAVDSSDKLVDVVGDYIFTFHSREKLLNIVRNSLDIISADKDVPVVFITFKSAVPEKAADFVNTLARVYIQDYIQSKYKAAETTVDFLDDRITRVAKDLSASENEIERYKDDKRIVDLRQESETDLRKIAQLKIQLSNLKISVDAMDELEENLKTNKARFLELAPNFQAHTDLLSTELIKKIKVFQAEKRDLLITYTPNDKRVQVVDDKINDHIIYLIEAVSNTKKNLKTKHDQLVIEINNAEKAFDGFASKQKDLTIMNRDFNIYEKSYNFLNEKRIEAEIAKAAKISFHRIISPAEISNKPVSPNRIIIVIFSGLMAFIGSIALIYLVHFAKGKINDEQTIEEKSDIPVSLRTPFLKGSKEIEEHFLKEAIQLEMKEILVPGQLIAVSSNSDKEGRDFHVTHLANALHSQGRKVLIVNANQSKLLTEVDTIDLSDERFRRLSKEELKRSIEEISSNYEIILMNNEALATERIGLALMNIASQNLYIVDSRRTLASHVDEVNLLVDEFGIKKPSFILNKYNYSPSVILQISHGIRSFYNFKGSRK